MKIAPSFAASPSYSSSACNGWVGGGYGTCHCYYSFTIVSKKNKNPQTSSEGSELSPPRITTNLKQNLQFLRWWKEFQKRKSQTPKPATSYRRKKVEKEEIPEEETELYRDPTLSLYYTNQGFETAVPVLLVDGYNMCGYWPKVKKHFLNGRLDVARQKLIDELITFSTLREVKVVVVFDATMSGLPTHKESFAGIDIVYSSETCADTWIEKEVVALKEDGCPKVWVVTSDRSHQHAAHGAGAFVWSCKALVSEPAAKLCFIIPHGSSHVFRNLSCGTYTSLGCLPSIIKIKATHKEMEMALRQQRSTSMQGKLLKHNLDSEVVNALKDLRDRLSENGTGI